ncbi:hypothetical protein AAHC03_01382 [Spirometra sp. Aus1]
MQAVVSRLPPSPQQSFEDVDYLSMPETVWSEDEEDHFPTWADSNEVELGDDIIAQLERIVTFRQQVFTILSTIPPNDQRTELKYDLMQKVENLETRAIVFLTLPPKSVYGDDYTQVDDNIYAPFGRFIADAEHYLRQAVALAESRDPLEETASDMDQVSSSESESSVEEPPVCIPGFSRTQALRVTKAIENAIFSLLSDPQYRTSTALVKTVIGSACSQITRNDPEHCLNRTNYLLTFLKGAAVRPPGSTIQGGDRFCLDALPGGHGRTYAWHCLITAAIAQAKHQFAYSLESTLPFAAVLATLLSCYPDEVPHFLSRLTLACPLLASFADGSLLQSLPEVIQPQESDLTAWRGVSRLFAAVLLARTPPGFKNRPPYLNPKLLWLTMAGLIRRPFFPQATAVVLLGLIEVGGFTLRRLYGRQTDRLLKTITKVIDNSEVLAYSAPELALITCIEEGLKTGKFPGGFGCLMDDFWG